MARKPVPVPEPEPEEEILDASDLASLAAANPFRHFTHGQTRVLFGIGEKSFRSLLAMEGAPKVANKINPLHFRQWLWESRASIGKLAE